jgi:hypothetical protein
MQRKRICSTSGKCYRIKHNKQRSLRQLQSLTHQLLSNFLMEVQFNAGKGFECKRKSSNRRNCGCETHPRFGGDMEQLLYCTPTTAQKKLALIDGLLDASEENFAATGKPL